MKSSNKPNKVSFTEKILAKRIRNSYVALYCTCYNLVNDILQQNNLKAIDYDTFSSSFSKILNDAKKNTINQDLFDKVAKIYDEGFNL